MLRSLILLSLFGICIFKAVDASDEWWKNSFIYQIYPSSFKDSDGDGVGDLSGITSKLEHLKDIDVNIAWLSPIYPSPMNDNGYDISNYTDINSLYGTIKDFEKLMKKAKKLGIKILLDFVPNHTSDKHPWFIKSVEKIEPYDKYYIWMDPKIINGTRYPPNNWLSAFHGSAWEWNDKRQQYYYHAYAISQPDLNYYSKNVKYEMENVLKFWLNYGVDGFRIDTIPSLIEDPEFRNEPKNFNEINIPDHESNSLSHIYTYNYNTSYPILEEWRKIIDDYNNNNDNEEIIFLTEAYFSFENIDGLIKYYSHGSHVPMNFFSISFIKNSSTANDYKILIDKYLTLLSTGHSPNWVISNHDNPRSASRFGKNRADQWLILSTILPGIVIIYQGDEIGMEDRPMTWKETKDPSGCNAGPKRYNLTSRDPARTPYQWDNTTSSGFSTNNTTWLPVHSNYHYLNLAYQKTIPISYYHVFKKLVDLKKHSIIKYGSTKIYVFEKNILGVVRNINETNRSIALLINLSDVEVIVNATVTMKLKEKMFVYVASVTSGIEINQTIFTNCVHLPPAASVILLDETI